MVHHVSDTVDRVRVRVRVHPVCPQNQLLSELSLRRAFGFISFPPQVDSGLVAALCAQEQRGFYFREPSGAARSQSSVPCPVHWEHANRSFGYYQVRLPWCTCGALGQGVGSERIHYHTL